MTSGDMVNDEVEVLNNQSMTIRPATSGIEWIIRNIYVPFGGSIELYRTDGTNAIKLLNSSTSLLSYQFHCSRDSYLTVKNVQVATVYLGYDGIISAE